MGTGLSHEERGNIERIGLEHAAQSVKNQGKRSVVTIPGNLGVVAIGFSRCRVTVRNR